MVRGFADSIKVSELIDTCWNVKMIALLKDTNFARINRYMLECK